MPLLCFITSYIATRKWIEMCKNRGLVSEDIHKRVRKAVPRIGGLPAALIATLAVFLPKSMSAWRELIAIISLAAIFIGLLDDAMSLRDLEKVLLSAVSFIPLGFYFDSVSIFGISFQGYLATILVVLLGTFSANATNTFAGFNGLEAGLSVIASSILSLLALLRDHEVEAMVLASFSASYLAFLYFNFYPARAFPGNCSTFQMGAFLASLSVVGDLVTPFLILMVPHALDFLLKLLSWKKMKEKKPTSIGKDGFLIPPPHLSLIGVLLRIKRMKELGLVMLIYFIEIILGFFAFIVTYVYFP
ncbi:MAG: hypothetical protein DRN90_08525 [Thermoproteota archaeon]|nr:MAG: hypothetical protein DRN90_08525 [Candidatus Korarchaeota archaeon]